MTSSGTFEYKNITSTGEADPFDDWWEEEEDADVTLEDDYSEEDYE